MEVELFDFLCSIYGKENVYLAYGDKVTKPGLSCVFYSDGMDYDKQLDGTTNLVIGNFTVDIWNDSMKTAMESSKLLIDKVEGTKYQVQNVRPVREDGYKRKWHRVIQLRIMEDFTVGTDF